MAISKFRVEVFPLQNTDLVGEYKIADHINLSGKAPSLGFNPVTDLYKAKHDKGAIVVACLKPGTQPSQEEAEFLVKQGVKAYSYSLLEPALYAAARSEIIDASAYVCQLPKGFKLYSGAAGFKGRASEQSSEKAASTKKSGSGKKDFGIIVSDTACKWAGTFTKNKARAACCDHNFDMLAKDVKALICNSGIANACTGTQGKEADKKLREIVAEKFSVNSSEVLTASTGKIGVQLDADLVDSEISRFTRDDSVNVIPNECEESQSAIKNFAEAILTTDTVIKVSQDAGFNMLGIAKGSGMINPNMATMLGFILSDVKAPCDYQQVLNRVIEKSFNAISVDGDTSTNDMVLFMTNETGKEISAEEFEASLEEVCIDLAKKIILDGEGTKSIIELKLKGFDDAKSIADEVLNSLLVKTAIFGHDPNWGRVISALGNAYAKLDKELKLDEISLTICGEKVFDKGLPTSFDRTHLSNLMKKHKFIELVIASNAQQSDNPAQTFYGSDLSYDYVEINAEYFT